MTDPTPTIPVSGKRPEWLRENNAQGMQRLVAGHWTTAWTGEANTSGFGASTNWALVDAVRFPDPEHPVNRILSLRKRLFDGRDGWVPWCGGDSAPSDYLPCYDPVLFRGGNSMNRRDGWYWGHKKSDADIIGYRPSQPKSVAESGGYVTVKQMTEEEADELYNQAPFGEGFMRILRRLNLILPADHPKPAESAAGEGGLHEPTIRACIEALMRAADESSHGSDARDAYKYSALWLYTLLPKPDPIAEALTEYCEKYGYTSEHDKEIARSAIVFMIGRKS